MEIIAVGMGKPTGTCSTWTYTRALEQVNNVGGFSESGRGPIASTRSENTRVISLSYLNVWTAPVRSLGGAVVSFVYPTAAIDATAGHKRPAAIHRLKLKI